MKLKKRYVKVIVLVSKGMKNSEVAARLHTTDHVIKNYLREIYNQLGLWNRVELALWYERNRAFGRRALNR